MRSLGLSTFAVLTILWLPVLSSWNCLVESAILETPPNNSTCSAVCISSAFSSSCPSQPPVCPIKNNTLPAESCQGTASAIATNWNATNLQQVMDAWKFTTFEQAQLGEFQLRLADIEHWKNDPAEAARFLREHNFDLSKAEHMFRGMVQWRLDQQMDAVMMMANNYGQPPDVFQHAPIFLLKGLDRDGDPIFVQRLGRIDGGGMYKRMGGPAMVQAFRFVSELQTSRTCGIRPEWQWQTGYYEPRMGRRMTQLTILVDLDGLSVRLLRPALLGIVKETARACQDHYPGLAKRVIVIRAPKVFQMAWKIAKHFYDARVHQKIVFAADGHDGDHDYLHVLEEYMDLDVLPTVIYERGHGQAMPGYFESIHMEGGRIPKQPKESSPSHSLLKEERNDENNDNTNDEIHEMCFRPNQLQLEYCQLLLEETS